MKLGEYGNFNFMKEDGKLIELVLVNLKTPYDVLCSSFCGNWMSHKGYRKGSSFGTLCDLLIKDQQKLLDEGKLGIRHKLTFSMAWSSKKHDTINNICFKSSIITRYM